MLNRRPDFEFQSAPLYSFMRKDPWERSESFPYHRYGLNSRNSICENRCYSKKLLMQYYLAKKYSYNLKYISALNSPQMVDKLEKKTIGESTI